MNSLKNHLSLIIALTTLLMSLQAFLSITAMIKKYEVSLSDDYAIVILAKDRLGFDGIKRFIPYADSLESIDTAVVFNEVKETLSESNLAYLKNAMPFFYRLKLNRYPSIDDRVLIEKELSKIDSVVRVETFAKTENKIYKLLLLNKTILMVFAVLMFFVGILLIVRQMEVWRFEHSRRITIMAIFGAPLWLRSAVLFRLSFIDSMISVLIVGGLFYYVSADSTFASLLTDIGLSEVQYDPIFSTLLLLGLSLFVSLSSALYVIFNAEEQNE
ncbi:cell division protein FtsX [Campylobacterota bacterium]|nr:cell division protein FtsX [Campylobacterota bacterium]